MAIHSEHLATLEAVLATALNIVKNRTLADPTSAGTTRASSVSGSSLRAVNVRHHNQRGMIAASLDK